MELKKKLKEIKEDFHNLRHEFSKKDADKYRKRFYDTKNYRHLSEIEIEEIRKIFNELEKSLNFKKPHNNINSIQYEDLDKDKDPDDEDADDDKYRKIGSVKDYLKSLVEIIINQQESSQVLREKLIIT